MFCFRDSRSFVKQNITSNKHEAFWPFMPVYTYVRFSCLYVLGHELMLTLYL